MNISGSMRIFRKDYEGSIFYSTTLSKKDEFGNYENLYINVQLPKGTSIENNTKVNIKKGFMSFYRNKNGLAMPKVVIQEFEIEKAIDTMPQYEGFYENINIEAYNSDELPF